MQTLYRINTISGYKPWRSGGPYYTSDPEIFKLFENIEEDTDFLYHTRAPGAIEDVEDPDYNEDDNLSEWLYHHSIEPTMPFILAGEVTFYVE